MAPPVARQGCVGVAPPSAPAVAATAEVALRARARAEAPGDGALLAPPAPSATLVGVAAGGVVSWKLALLTTYLR